MLKAKIEHFKRTSTQMAVIDGLSFEEHFPYSFLYELERWVQTGVVFLQNAARQIERFDSRSAASSVGESRE